MIKSRAILIILFLLLFHKAAHSQAEDFRFSHITPNNGLPHSLVFTIYQDSLGFMWFGTSNGLARYDGSNYKVYQPNPDNTNTLSHKQIMQIIADNNGNMWLRMQYPGLNVLDPHTDKITRYVYDPKKKNSLPGRDIWNLYKDHQGRMWVTTNGGICNFDYNLHLFISFQSDSIAGKSVKIPPPSNITEDAKGWIWLNSVKGIATIDFNQNKICRFGAVYKQLRALDTLQINNLRSDGFWMWITTEHNGLYQFNCKTGQLQHFSSASKNDNLPTSSLNAMFVSKKGDVFITSENPDCKLFTIDHQNKQHPKFRKYAFSGDVSKINAFSEDKAGNIWLSTNMGLFRYNISTQTFMRYLNNPANQFSINGNHPYAMLMDKNDILWLSIYKVGIDLLDLKQKMFYKITENPLNPKNGLPENNIVSILKDHLGNLWMGTLNSGVVRFEPKKNKYTAYGVGNKDPRKLEASASGALFEDQKGNIWVGSWYKKIDIINPKTNKITRFGNDPKVKEWSVRKIVADRSGNIWIASIFRGLIEYDPENKQFYFPSEAYEKNFTENGLYRTIFIDKKNQVWLGTQSGGLLFFDQKAKKFIHYKNDLGNTNTISSNTVYSIFEDKKGVLWIGTASGLNAFYPKTKVFKRYYVKNGLCNNTIYSILPDGSGNLWLTTDNGLSKFNLTANSFTNYDESDGLLSNVFNSNSFYRSNNGEIFLGTPNGLIHFNPSEIKDDPTFRPPVFTSLKLFNKPVSAFDTINKVVVLNKDISYTDHFTLTHNDYLFTVEFSSLDYASPEKIKYKYKLEGLGFDTSWVITDNRFRSLTYTNLSPGNYVLKLRATNSLGGWPSESNERQLRIKILPPFWMTWYFRIAVSLLILFSILFWYFRKIRIMRLRQEKLENTVKSRTKELSETNVILEEQKEELELQKETLEEHHKTLQEVNQILESQKEEIEIQNEELYGHRLKLEELVEERTRELNNEKHRAEASDSLKSAFLANMSHEIRTPLNAIVGFSSMLYNPAIESSERDDFIRIINASCETLLVLIDDILDLSKIEAGQMQISIEAFPVKEVIQQLGDMFAQRAQKANVNLYFAGSSEKNHLYINSDRARFKQIMTNLISNALKFTEKGDIKIGYKVDDEVIFFVSDSGIGISEDDQKTIFERFRKVEDTSKKVYSGTGLGLAISKKLAEMLGGKIWVESELNKGSTFYFSQPIFTSNEEPNGNPNVTKKIKIDNSLLTDKKIIIVEDEANNYYFLEKFLEKMGADVIGFKNGIEVVDYFNSKENIDADLILMDIKMPEMNGYDAAAKIKDLYPTIPIIAQTAFAMVEDIKLIKASRFDDYIIKPINANLLKQLLAKYLG